MENIFLSPVTRINGNASIRLSVDDQGSPQDIRFQAFGYRGFEQIARGAHIDNVMGIVSRICGADSVFHQIAAASAMEQALGVSVAEEALYLRQLAMWAQLFERHAVSLIVHSLPDLLFPSSDPGLRNIISINRVDEDVVKRVMRLKSLGTSILREAGGKAVHPINFVPGGAVRDIEPERKRALIEELNEARPLLVETGRLLKLLLRRNEENVNDLGKEPTSYLAVRENEGVALLGARLDAVDPAGKILGSYETREAAAKITESPVSHSHIKYASFLDMADLRVGPLARLNVNESYGTPLADEELEEVKAQWGFPLHHSMTGHAARILEMIHAWERMIELLNKPGGGKLHRELTSRAGRGVGVVEAPEGLLVYEIALDDEGVVEEANIFAPLQFNLQALERTLEETARNILGALGTGEQAKNLMEVAVRAYAPCIPCGVH